MKTIAKSWSPQNPGRLVASGEEIEPEGVALTVVAARRAQLEWWDSSVAQRATALTAVADEISARSDEAVALVVSEVGKPLNEATGEVARAEAIVRYYAQAGYAAQGDVYASVPGSMVYTRRKPLGVAGLITPWNFPLAIPLWKAAPALAAGNAVVLKPSPDALGCAQLLESILSKHLPANLFALAVGGPTTGAALVDAVDVLSFTGSVGVGRSLLESAARARIPVQCEMGGHNAAIVLPDADPGTVAATLAGAAMGYAGQKCTATRRVIVVGEQPQFEQALVHAISGLSFGAPERADTAVGPVINDRARSKVESAIQSVKHAGATLLTGGGTAGADGWFVEPALVKDVPSNHPVATDEVFGPLTLLQHASDVDEAIAMCNGSSYGLVTSVHGRDLDQLLAVGDRVDTGLVKINAPTTGVDFWAPFGGEKDSSYGQREQGSAALSFYASTRTVTVSPHG